ncbi:MAG: hypothetical protein RLZZ241_1102 [Bacteroidota bacterium]|jgi:alpha-L-fucosidase 2
MTYRSFSILMLSLTCCLNGIHAQQTREIWYSEPASDWDHALPVGNGRLGAMVFGNPTKERLQLNEDSLWPGGPEWGNSRGTPEDLQEIRNLILAGKLHLADSLIVERFSYKSVTRSHQTLGDLFLEFDSVPITDYKRSLNLDSALVKTSYLALGYKVTQQVFASAADNALVVHLSTNNPSGLNLKINLSRPNDGAHKTAQVTVKNNMIIMSGEVTQYGGSRDSKPEPITHGVRFETVLTPQITGGQIISQGNTLRLEGVQQATLLLVAATSFYHDNPSVANTLTLQELKNISYQDLLQRHVTDHQALFHRVALKVDGPNLDTLSTSLRLSRIKKGQADPGLETLLFDFGRYLLMGSSRPGTNPANLQGIWNEHIQAPWNADYHLNINLQMNYWPAEVTGLSECHMPLFDYTDRLIERGKILAKEQYGMPGAVVHHASDLWAPAWMRAATPYWGSWIHGGGWLSRHYWEHYVYTQDEAFLKERGYPALKAFSEFYLAWLTENPNGDGLISFPETSPENSYIAPGGKHAAISKGTAMGYQIIRDVLENTLAAAKIIDTDQTFQEQIQSTLIQMPTGLQIGPDGRLLEWSESLPEAEEGHRHMSHLYALYPDESITAAESDLFEAAANTIQYRLDHGGAGPGWSRAWIINFYARLLQPESAYEHVQIFLKQSIYENLMDVHPPFQIDGNFGYTAGIAEMLLQSHEREIRILPALPKAWSKGEVTGLRARGNLTVDIAWETGEMKKITLYSPESREIYLRYAGKLQQVSVLGGTPNHFNGALQKID